MAFRIGKSVMMNFGDELEPIFIFAGLSTLLVIGPLLRWYVVAMTRPQFALSMKNSVELIPFVIVFISGLFITQEWFDNNNHRAIILFGSVLIFIYLHFAFYIFLSWKIVRRVAKHFPKAEQTKSQQAIMDWLNYLIIGFVLIWISYFLNILDDTVPYIAGPIMYSIVIYFLSFKAFQLNATELNGYSFKENSNLPLFNKISELIMDQKLYLESDLSLAKLSNLIGKSTQSTSSVINQYAKQNFNDFINFYRIQEAKAMLSNMENDKFTISSIAFDTGFSSLSSFNSAFKKFESQTPSSFRKSVSTESL